MLLCDSNQFYFKHLSGTLTGKLAVETLELLLTLGFSDSEDPLGPQRHGREGSTFLGAWPALWLPPDPRLAGRGPQGGGSAEEGEHGVTQLGGGQKVMLGGSREGHRGLGPLSGQWVQPFPCIRITRQAPPCDCSSGGLQSRSGFQDSTLFSCTLQVW